MFPYQHMLYITFNISSVREQPTQQTNTMLGFGENFGRLRHSNSKIENSWKMKKYAPKISITTFASFLSLGGMLGSLIFIIGSLIMILMVKIYCDEWGAKYQVLYGIGFSVLFTSIGLKFFCIKLWKTIKTKNMDRLIKLVKNGNYTLAGFEVIACVALIIFNNLYSESRSKHLGFHILMVIITGFYILLDLLKIFGTIKLKPGLINASILFNFFINILAVILTIISLQMFAPISDHNVKELCLLIAVMMFLLISCIFIYFNGFVVLLYNILLEERVQLESCSQELVEMDGSILLSNPSGQMIENEYTILSHLF